MAGRLTELVRDGDRLLIGTGAAEPPDLLAELVGETAHRRKNLELIQVTTGSSGLVRQAAAAGHRVLSPVGGHEPAVAALPSSMMQLAHDITSGALRIDGVLFSGTEAGDDLAPALCVDIVPAAFEVARFRAVEYNRRLPDLWVRPLLPRSACELECHSEHPLPELTPAPVGPAAKAIGEYLAELIPDGAAVEVGVGRSLAGLAPALIERGQRLSVHSGLISDWTRSLVEEGVVDRPLACAGAASVVTATAMGTTEFYRWLHRNDDVLAVDSYHAHDPAHLAALPRFVAVNAASRVDCSGQVGVAARDAGRRGVGGLLDFSIAGSYAAGSVIAVESVDGRGESRIVASLTDVQLPSQLVTHVVTEHGVARLAGQTWQQRRREMIAVAHPDHRAELRRASPPSPPPRN